MVREVDGWKTHQKKNRLRASNKLFDIIFVFGGEKDSNARCDGRYDAVPEQQTLSHVRSDQPYLPGQECQWHAVAFVISAHTVTHTPGRHPSAHTHDPAPILKHFKAMQKGRVRFFRWKFIFHFSVFHFLRRRMTHAVCACVSVHRRVYQHKRMTAAIFLTSVF